MNKTPPKYPLRFFHWFCEPDYAEDIEGDLMERFEKRTKEKRAARWLFILDVMKLFRPGIIRNFEGSLKLNYYGMIKHYLLFTFRSFKKEKTYTAINLLGLTVSLCSCLLIWQYVADAYSFDSHQENLSNKYRINYNYFQHGELTQKSSLTTSALGAEIVERVSGIKNMVRVRPIHTDEGLVISDETSTKKFLEFKVSYVEKSFLEFFDYTLASGNEAQALSSPNNIVLTKKTADKFFGSENPIGKVLHINGGTLTGDFVVSGVLNGLTTGTHLDFDYLIPIEFLLSHYGLYTRSDGWQWQNFYTYLELEDRENSVDLALQIDDLISDRIGHTLKETDQVLKTSFQPLKNIYLDSFIDGDGGLNKGNKFNIRIFSLAAIVILIIAGINYVNLASSRALTRGQGVALRKALGANNRQLIYLFLCDSLVLNILAAGLGGCLAYLLAPTFGSLIGSQVSFRLFHEFDFWIMITSFLLITSVITGVQPALLSLRSGSLKGKITIEKGGVFLRKMLITFQLMISLVLVAGTLLVYHQISHMKSMELGLNMDRIFVVKGSRAVVKEGRDIAKAKIKRFKDVLVNQVDIEAVSSSSNVPGTGGIWYGGVRKLGDPRDVEVPTDVILVDEDFTNAYDFEFLAGEPFVDGMRDYEAVIINQSALKAYGLSSPAEALSHSVVLENMDTMRVQGVVKDIHWNSLHEPIGPEVYGVVNMFNAFLSIKLNTSSIKETLALIEDTYREIYPDDPYVSFFLNDEFNQQYKSEQTFGQTFGVFTIIGIIISSVGLFALVSYLLSQKVKEIGIRKVLGANSKQLFQLLSREYLIIFSIALVMASGTIIIGANEWLNEFAYRISIGIDLIVLPSLLVAFVTFSVIGGKILQAMKVDPAKQLRDE